MHLPTVVLNQTKNQRSQYFYQKTKKYNSKILHSFMFIFILLKITSNITLCLHLRDNCHVSEYNRESLHHSHCTSVYKMRKLKPRQQNDLCRG